MDLVKQVCWLLLCVSGLGCSMAKCKTCPNVGPFGERYYKGRGEYVPYKLCIDCRSRQSNRYHNTSYGESVRCKQKEPEARAHQATLSKAAPRKIAKKRAYGLWAATEEGQRARREADDRRAARIRASAGLRMQQAVKASMRTRLAGTRHGESVNLANYTDFASVEDMTAHFESEMKPGMTHENYGSFWSIAHKIPQRYYCFDDPEDIRRCNSKANLGCDYEVVENPLCEKTNAQKSDSIPTTEALKEIDRASWPKAFGVELTAAKRIQLSRR